MEISAQFKEKIAAYYSGWAKKSGLTFLPLDMKSLDASLLKADERPDYIRLQAIPIRQTESSLVVATANPEEKNQKEIMEYWRKKFQKNIEIVMTSRQDIVSILSEKFIKKYTYEISNKHHDVDPLHSASYTCSLKQKIFLLFILAVIICFIGYIFFAPNTSSLLINVFFGFNLFFAVGTLIVLAYKFFLAMMTLTSQRVAEHRKDEYYELDELNLPMYTILIPLLREKKETVTYLMKSLARLDYPVEKLDIKLLLEADDTQTYEVIKQFDLPWYFQILAVPPGLPRSKPRACNYGLEFAFGEFLAIYDAEDCPDADQLKKALRKFYKHVERYHDEKLVCVQARLNFYNSTENILARLFTLEYTHWFDLLIPALAYLRDPVPLGGTSNHFKVWFLREVCGWDPSIGTEDADIGMRIYRHGYYTTTVESTTYEEANTKVGNWLKQRTRWNKGYMQTYLVNMRDPIKMIKQLGFREFFSFQIFVGGNVFVSLVNLPLWLFFFIVFLIPADYSQIYPRYVLYLCIFNFTVANAMLLLAQFIGAYRRHFYNLLLFVPLVLLYWMLMSVAGYLALYDLLVRPSYWYKTEHGLSKEAPKI